MPAFSDHTAPPSGLITRPLEVSDSRALYELIAAQEVADIGVAEIEEADLLSEWQRPSYDLANNSIAVFDPADNDRLVGYVEYLGDGRYDAAVHPTKRGGGIGVWLAGWVQDLARSRGIPIIGMPVPQGSQGDRLLTALGYHVRWTSWVLRLPEGAQVAERPLPDGYAVREATPADHEQIWTVTEDAFLEWSERERMPLADYAATVWERPGFEPWHLQVVTAPDGAVVGVANAWNAGGDGALDTYVSKLAVAREHRNRGLAQVLLVAAFAAGRAHGAVTSSLSTDSRTGALTLYEKVGMTPASIWVHRGIHID